MKRKILNFTIITALLIFVSGSTFGSEAREQLRAKYRLASRQAVILADLHFCLRMASGEKLTQDADGYVWKGMHCESVLDRAFETGITKAEVVRIAVSSFHTGRSLSDSTTSIDWDALEPEIQKAIDRAAVRTNLRLCREMDRLSLSKTTRCEASLKEAHAAGLTDEEIASIR